MEEERETDGLVADVCDQHLCGRTVAEQGRDEILLGDRRLARPGSLVFGQLEDKLANEPNVAPGRRRNARFSGGREHGRIIRLAELGVNAIFCP